MICGSRGLIHRSWLSPCGVRSVRHVLSAVLGPVEALGAHEHDVGVGGVGGDVRVVEGARDELGVVAHLRPGVAGVVGAIEPAARLRLDQRVDAARVRGADRDVALAEEPGGQPAAQLLPRVAAVGAAVDAALARAGDDRPRLALGAPHRGVEHVRVAGLELDVHGAGAVGDEEHLLPRPAAVARAEHAALAAAGERVADGGDEHRVGSRGWMRTPPICPASRSPTCSTSCRRRRCVDPPPRGHVAADPVGAGADPDDVRVGGGHVDGADGAGLDEAVGDVEPALPGVGGLPHAAAGGAHVEGVRLLGHAGHGGDAAAARGPDHPVAHGGEPRRVEHRMPGCVGPSCWARSGAGAAPAASSAARARRGRGARSAATGRLRVIGVPLGAERAGRLPGRWRRVGDS